MSGAYQTDTTYDIVTPKSLGKIKQELLQMRRSPQGRKADELISIAHKLGMVRDNRGKEPTYIREMDPHLSPPLSIPAHGAKDMKTGTARNIIDTLLDYVSEWEIHLDEANDDNDIE